MQSCFIHSQPASQPANQTNWSNYPNPSIVATVLPREAAPRKATRHVIKCAGCNNQLTISASSSSALSILESDELKEEDRVDVDIDCPPALPCPAMWCYAMWCYAMLCYAFPSLVKASTRHTSTIEIHSLYVISNCAFPNRLFYYYPISELGIHFHFRRHNLAFIDTIYCDHVSLNKAFNVLYRPSLWSPRYSIGHLICIRICIL